MRFIIVISVLFISSCISFRGVTIPTGVNTFYVEMPVVNELNAPPELAQIFMETLRQKVREQSRLVWNENEPDVVFTPIIKRYTVTSVAPQEGDLVAFNRLDVSISIDYENTISEEEDDGSYSKSFQAFQDFNASENLQDLEEGLIALIFDDITERIFNDTFSDW